MDEETAELYKQESHENQVHELHVTETLTQPLKEENARVLSVQALCNVANPEHKFLENPSDPYKNVLHSKRKRKRVKPLAKRVFRSSSDMNGSVKKPKMIITVAHGERDDEDGDEEEEDGWVDQNRWYCNICKDGGELLCCDRCPRAFHTRCLNLSDTDIPDSEWYCKLCTDCLNRRRLNQESKEKAKILRETERLEKEENRKLLLQKKEDAETQKAMDAVELKAKRILEMQDRIICSRKKVRYRDKEEEKLGKIVENQSEIIRAAKEKVDKLEKEETALKRKEESLDKRKKLNEKGEERFSIVDNPDSTFPNYLTYKKTIIFAVSVHPSDMKFRHCKPVKCEFQGIPDDKIGQLLSIFDCLSTFHEALKLSHFAIEQLFTALSRQKHSPLLGQIHICLLEVILKDKEDEDYASDIEHEMDERERHRLLLKNTPFSLGVPSCRLLNYLSWPSVMSCYILAMPRFHSRASPVLQEALESIGNTEYPELKIEHKLTFLQFLVSRVYQTEKIRKIVRENLDQLMKVLKEYNRTMLQGRREHLEEEKRLAEKQRIELTTLEKQRPSASGSSNDNDLHAKLSDSISESFDESSLHHEDMSTDLEEEIAMDKRELKGREEELELLEEEGKISRSEYITQRKELDFERTQLEKREKAVKHKRHSEDESKHKEKLAQQALKEALATSDASTIHSAILKAEEANVSQRYTLNARHLLENLRAEMEREKELENKRRAYQEQLRKNAIRTEPLGMDEMRHKYWYFKGDPTRIYVQVLPVVKTDPSLWYCYSSYQHVTALLEAKKAAKSEHSTLGDTLCDRLAIVLKEMPRLKQSFAISELLSDAQSSQEVNTSVDPLTWTNTFQAEDDSDVSVQAFQKELTQVHFWLSKRLTELGSDWKKRISNGQKDWLDLMDNMRSLEDCSAPLLHLEREAIAVYNANLTLPEKDTATSAMEITAYDEEDDEEEEEEKTIDDGSLLWPTLKHRTHWIQAVKKCKTLAMIALALAVFVERLQFCGISEHDVPRAKSTRPKRDSEGRYTRGSRKYRYRKGEYAASDDGTRLDIDSDDQMESESSHSTDPKQRLQIIDDDASESGEPQESEQWDEECYICFEGGEVVCCDGCHRVFHLTCIGLRRLPRGKIYCQNCSGKEVSTAESISMAPKRLPEHKALDSCIDTSSDRISDANSVTGEASDSSLVAWDTECALCLQSGDLLRCEGCPRSFHVSCLQLKSRPKNDWFCSDCDKQICGVCKKNKIRLHSHVICGSEDGTMGCDQVFHLKCVHLQNLPKDDWFCSECRRSLGKAKKS